MKNIFKSHHPKRQVKSFKYAFEGIWHTLLNEANFRVQMVFAVFIIILAFILNISPMEWALLILSTGFLLSAEMINTVVEEFIDNLIQEYHEGAKVIKDVSAGFVLIAAVTTLAITLLIFVPKLLVLVQ